MDQQSLAAIMRGRLGMGDGAQTTSATYGSPYGLPQASQSMRNVYGPAGSIGPNPQMNQLWNFAPPMQYGQLQGVSGGMHPQFTPHPSPIPVPHPSPLGPDSGIPNPMPVRPNHFGNEGIPNPMPVPPSGGLGGPVGPNGPMGPVKQPGQMMGRQRNWWEY